MNHKRTQKTFKEKAYIITRQIPKGKVATYGQIARLAGNAKAARAVGTYMRTNSDAPNTPCHRVIAFDGSLVGYSAHGGILTKRKMLEKEGVVFKGNKVDLSKFLWRK